MKIKYVILLFVAIALYPACGLKKLTTEHDLEIIKMADACLKEVPFTITKYSCPRSQGGVNDFYSEGDYWWPNPEDLNGPYIRRDGLTNPDNFLAHRTEMKKLNESISYLASAFILTKNKKYLSKIEEQLNSFFINPATRMNPSLLYGQAIKGLFSGRGIGIIDTIHLIELARAVYKLKGTLPNEVYQPMVKWFEDYTNWITQHKYGIEEKNNGNNHSTWWAAQVMAFSQLTQNIEHYSIAETTFKELLTKQLAKDGSFPEETKRTKPYNYSLFNLEGFTLMCMISKQMPQQANLWNYSTPNGSLKSAWTFMSPFLIDKSKWPFPKDVQYADDLPISTVGMSFATQEYNLINLKNKIKDLPSRANAIDEVKRNFPLINNLLWLQ
jgi:hypothetical protein